MTHRKLSTLGNFGTSRHAVVQYHDNVPDVKGAEAFEAQMKFNHVNERNGLAIFTIQHCVRRMLPYGKWFCSDGRIVVFNREYQPIFQLREGVYSHADRDELVENIESSQMLYDDCCNPAEYLCKHLGYIRMDRDETRRSKVALLNCLRVMQEFSVKEHSSVNHSWSLLSRY